MLLAGFDSFCVVDSHAAEPIFTLMLPATSPCPESTRLLTLKEASELVRTPIESIRYWIYDGRLKAFKPGRNVLVKEADLLALVESRETGRIRANRFRAAVTRRR